MRSFLSYLFLVLLTASNVQAAWMDFKSKPISNKLTNAEDALRVGVTSGRYNGDKFNCNAAYESDLARAMAKPREDVSNTGGKVVESTAGFFRGIGNKIRRAFR